MRKYQWWIICAQWEARQPVNIHLAVIIVDVNFRFWWNSYIKISTTPICPDDLILSPGIHVLKTLSIPFLCSNNTLSVFKVVPSAFSPKNP